MRHAYKGEGGDRHIQVHTPESGFLHAFCNSFFYNVLSSFFLVFGDDSHCYFFKTFAYIIFLSRKFFTVLFSMELLIRLD